jgi:hypothetical protein
MIEQKAGISHDSTLFDPNQLHLTLIGLKNGSFLREWREICEGAKVRNCE